MQTIFLDRDGVINENRSDHVKSWSEFRFLPGALAAIRSLHEAGFTIFVITNQAIIERGLADIATLHDIHKRMSDAVRLAGGSIKDIRYCPHDANSDCQCRKPRAGMLLDLARTWHVDLSRSFLIGDAWTDIAAGQSVSCKSILVRTGRGAEQLNTPQLHQHPPAFIARDILDAAHWVIEHTQCPCIRERSLFLEHHRADLVTVLS